MIVTGIGPEQFREIVQKVGDTTYAGNLRAEVGREYSATRFAGYPATASKNVGSQFQPAYMPELCDCDHYGIDTREEG